MKFATVLFAMSLNSVAFSGVESKLACPEVEATEAKCKDYEAQNVACDALVQTEIKARIDAAKTQLDECKKKNSLAYLVKCKKEISNATTLTKTPKQVASGPIQKELIAKADSPCAKAEAIGTQTSVCKGPKKLLETMKANCIKP